MVCGKDYKTYRRGHVTINLPPFCGGTPEHRRAGGAVKTIMAMEIYEKKSLPNMLATVQEQF